MNGPNGFWGEFDYGTYSGKWAFQTGDVDSSPTYTVMDYVNGY
ncbi:MAG: hypothetical protein Q8936_10830 [Bacillota bacterium]|nr:hypothetical protein [Bacillota bacterium]